MSVNQQIISYLKSINVNTPETQELSLEFMQISDLLPYMDLLSQLRYLKKLSLHGNRLKQLPIDMSRLDQLEELDISNNLIGDVTLAIISLQTLPSLKQLNWPLTKEKQSLVAEQIPNLHFLNNVKVVRETVESSSKNYHNEELKKIIQEVQKLYNKLSNVQSQFFQNQSQNQRQSQFLNSIDEKVRQAAEKMEGGGEDGKPLSGGEEKFYFQYVLFSMYQLVKKPTLEFCSTLSDDLLTLICELCTQQDKFVSSMVEIALSSMNIKHSEPKNSNRSDGQYLRIEKELNRLRKQRDEVLGDITQLQAQNKKYLQLLVKYTKGQKVNIDISSPILSKSLHHSHHADKPKVGSSAYNTSQISHIVPALTHTNQRVLTLKQLKDTIEEIYEGKIKYDKKSADGRMGRQTMHQYLFTHLNQKYGLKVKIAVFQSLTIQAANSIVSAIQVYSAEDNDVAVFGKILRNEIDEQFRNVQVELKATLHNLLKMHLKSQHPYKSASEVNDLYNEKLNGEISNEQYEDIVSYLYNQKDAGRILRKIQAIIQEQNNSREEPPRRFHSGRRDRKQTKEIKKKGIKFQLLLQAVLDFQLKNHEKLLQPLIKTFKTRDSDSDGIINQEQFIEIIEQMCSQANDLIPQLLNIVDPYETKQITFTQTVRLLANYPEQNPILMRYLSQS